MSETFSPVVSLYNLNQIYTDLNNRIESLNTIYNPKGSDTSINIKALNTHSAGDVWNITDSFNNKGVTIPADTNWVYVTTEPNIAAKDYFAASGSGYWVRVGSFLDIARDDKAGLICTGGTGANSIDSLNDDNGTSFDRGLKLKANTNKAFVTIPAASETSYGVLTTGEQHLKGDKVLDGDLTVKALSAETLRIGEGSAEQTVVTGKLIVDEALEVTHTLNTDYLYCVENAEDDPLVLADLKWAPLPEGSLTLKTDNISAQGLQANTITVADLDSDNNNITLGQNTTITTPAINATTSLTAATISGINQLLGGSNNVTLGQANTTFDIQTITATSLSTGSMTTSTLTSDGTAHITKTFPSDSSTVPVYAVTASTLTVNNTLHVNGSNLSATNWNRYSDISEETVDSAARLNTLTVSGTTSVTNLNATTLTVNNTVATASLAKSSSNPVLTNLYATGNVSVGDLTLYNANADPTDQTLTVQDAVTTAHLKKSSSNVVLTNLYATGDISVGALTLKNGTTWKDLTVQDAVTTAHLKQSSATAALTNLYATGAVSVGALTLNNGSADQTLTVQDAVTTAHLKKDSNTVALTNLYASGAVTVGALTLKNASDVYQDLTVQDAVTTAHLKKDSNTVALTNIYADSDVSIGKLTLKNGNTWKDLTVQNNVTTASLKKASDNVVLDAIYATGTVSVKDLSLSKTENNTTTYYDLTVNNGVTAASLDASGAALTVNGTSVDVKNLTVSNGALTVSTGDVAVNTFSGSGSTLNISTSASASTLAVSSGTLTVSGNATATNLYGSSDSTAVPKINISTAAQVGTLSMTSQQLTVSNDTIATNLYGSSDSTAVPKINISTAAKLGTLAMTSQQLTVSNDTTATYLYGSSNSTAVPTINISTAAKVDTLSMTSQQLTVSNDTTATYLYGSSNSTAVPTINISTAAKVDTLSMTNRTLTVSNNVTATQLYGSTSSDAVPIISVGSEVEVDKLSMAGKTLTVTNNASANTLTATSGTIQVTGTGNAVTIGTLQGGTNPSSIAGTGDINSSSPQRFTNTGSGSIIPTVAVDGGCYFTGGIQATKIFNAVWNDLSDRIEIDIKPEPGYAYSLKNGHYQKTSKYMEQGYIGIHSDTSGFEMGGKDTEFELNTSVAGFVLAYVDKVYKPGTPLTVTKDGKLTKIRAIGRILHPEMVVATFWKPELKPTFGVKNGEVKVNGRMWVKIK